jgi:putative addiction module component (TIGR02574 family)
MSLPLPSPPAGFDDLPVEQQIDYVQTLWDRIAARGAEAPVPAWHSEVLEERLAGDQDNPDAGRPWEQVEADLRKRLTGR